MDMDVIYNPNLALYIPLWKRDGAAFRSDDGYGHVCTVTGATWEMQGRSFISGQYINFPVTSPLNLSSTADFAIGVWVNFTKPSAGTQSNIISFRTSSTRGIALQANESGVVNLYMRSATGATATPILGDNSGSFLHAMATYASATNTANIYKNGELESSTAGINDVIAATANNIGHNYIVFGTAEGFVGTVGEAIVYTRAPTPLEIQNLYLATKGRYQ